LELNFNISHWAGLIDYTTPYEFAIYYVFKKQSKTLSFKTLYSRVNIIPKFMF
jgi:hypothetical protein